jgi:hypothetical protein
VRLFILNSQNSFSYGRAHAAVLGS